MFVSIPRLRRTPSQLLVTYRITSTWQYIASSILVRPRTCVMKHDEAIRSISVFGCASHLVHVHHLQISFRNPKRFLLCQGPHSNASFFNGAENPQSNCLRSKQTKQLQYSMFFTYLSGLYWQVNCHSAKGCSASAKHSETHRHAGEYAVAEQVQAALQRLNPAGTAHQNCSDKPSSELGLCQQQKSQHSLFFSFCRVL